MNIQQGPSLNTCCHPFPLNAIQPEHESQRVVGSLADQNLVQWCTRFGMAQKARNALRLMLRLNRV